jgi:hypothetical protein
MKKRSAKLQSVCFVFDILFFISFFYFFTCQLMYLLFFKCSLFIAFRYWVMI